MIRPLRDRVVVKPQVRQLSAVIAVENKEKFNEGVIAAIGPKVGAVKVGEFIKYGNGTYLDWPLVNIDGEDYQIIQEADIACVVER
jgi:co-chaperonin GroES (HSP10)